MKTIIISIVLIISLSCCKERERALVVSKIQQASKLATTETVVDKIVFGTSTKKLLRVIRINKAMFAASSTAYIKTGIDLSKIKKEHIKIGDHNIEIKLPPVEVINFSYPFAEFKIDSTITVDRFLNRFEISDYENFYRLAELDIRNNLNNLGIREATEQKTRIMLEGLLKNLGYEEIYITFSQADTLIKPIEFPVEQVE